MKTSLIANMSVTDEDHNNFRHVAVIHNNPRSLDQMRRPNMEVRSLDQHIQSLARIATCGRKAYVQGVSRNILRLNGVHKP
jgi:hypothetical protein